MESKEKKILLVGITLSVILCICLCVFCTDNTVIKSGDEPSVVDLSPDNQESTESGEYDANSLSEQDTSVNTEDNVRSEESKTNNSINKNEQCQDSSDSEQRKKEFETEKVDI